MRVRRAGWACSLLLGAFCARSAVAVTATDEPAQFVLSAASLVPRWLRALNVDARFSAQQIEWRGTLVTALDVPLTGRRGVIVIDGARAVLGGGTLALSARHAGHADSHMNVTLEDVRLEAIGPLRAYLQATPVAARVELHGRGRSLRALASSLAGRVVLHNVGPGTIPKSFERTGSNLLTSVVNAFGAMRQPGEVTTLECLHIDLPIADGEFRAKRAIALRTPRVEVRGGGRIDFVRERLRLRLKPASRSGFNLKSLNAVKAILITGSFAAPRVELDTGKLIERAASLGLDVAGGAVLKALTADEDAADHPCAATDPSTSPRG
jgi:uncharacterized protein involved in outer membrane biogenesis